MAFSNYHSGPSKWATWISETPNSSSNSMSHANQQLRSSLMNPEGIWQLFHNFVGLFKVLSFGPLLCHSALSVLPHLPSFTWKSATITSAVLRSKKADKEQVYQETATSCFQSVAWILKDYYQMGKYCSPTLNNCLIMEKYTNIQAKWHANILGAV